MSTIYSGGCACGAIRYRTERQPIFQNHCQCSDCRKLSGTGHGSYLTFPDKTAMAITGEATSWRVAGDSGSDKFHAFCPTCGSPVYLTFAAMPDFIAVHAGSLDEPSLFEPEMVTYAVRGLPWDTMDAHVPKAERMPEG